MVELFLIFLAFLSTGRFKLIVGWSFEESFIVDEFWYVWLINNTVLSQIPVLVDYLDCDITLPLRAITCAGHLFLLCVHQDNLLISSSFSSVITPDMDKSLESREISRNTDLARSLSLEKIEFSFSFSSRFSRFWRKILFLFSIYENLKHKSRSLLDLDLEFSSGSVCVWN